MTADLPMSRDEWLIEFAGAEDNAATLAPMPAPADPRVLTVIVVAGLLFGAGVTYWWLNR